MDNQPEIISGEIPTKNGSSKKCSPSEKPKVSWQSTFSGLHNVIIVC